MHREIQETFEAVLAGMLGKPRKRQRLSERCPVSPSTVLDRQEKDLDQSNAAQPELVLEDQMLNPAQSL